jgi:hypothetical protein
MISNGDYIVFSASQDNEESLATPDGSLFTNAIYETFTKNEYLNKPLKDIKDVLVSDVINYANKTGNRPHHPSISFSSSSMKNKSIKDFMQSKATTTNTPIENHNNNSKPTIGNEKISSLETTLNNLLSSNKVDKMSLSYNKKIYKEGEHVQFTIDTQNRRGYLTIFYIDGSDVTILYPNPYVSSKILEGKYKFPDDLSNGQFVLEAYKSCKNCKEERTVIYTLLSSKPITDINSIKSKGLFSFPKNSKKSESMSRAVRIKAMPTNTTYKPLLGKYEFIVK